MSDDTFIQLTAEIVSAQVSNNLVPPEKIAGLIEAVFTALSTAANPAAPKPAKQEPAVSVRASVKPDYIVCLEDGLKRKSLKQHLRTAHDMTSAEYRAKWELPSDYPLVAPNYSEKRSAMSLALGLGRKKTPAPIAEPEPAPIAEPRPAPVAKRGRPRKVSAEPAEVASPEAVVKPARKPRAKKAPIASPE
jgi:predicted transcriptional regulator